MDVVKMIKEFLFSKLSFRNKLIAVFSLVIVLSILSIGFFSYYEASQTIEADIKKFNNKILKEVNLNLERYFNEYEQIFLNIATNKEYERWLMVAKGDDLQMTLSYGNISDYCIKPIAPLHPEIISIGLLNYNGNESIYYISPNLFFRQGYSLSNERFIKDMPLNNKNLIIPGPNNAYRDYKGDVNDLLYMRLLRKFSFSANVAGYVQLDISIKPVIDILKEMSYSDKGEGMLLDETGLIMADTDTTKIFGQYDKEFFNDKIKGIDNGYVFDKGKQNLIIFGTIKNNGWKSVAIIPYRDVAGGIYRIRIVTIIIATLSLILFVFLIILISSSLTRRIQKMLKVIKQTQMGNIHVRVNISGMDEISSLASAYNSMLDHIEKYLNELTEARLMQQEAVVSALQAQINSHFLYNTLEMVSSMAYVAEHKNIYSVVISLSKMLRYTSNYRDYIVSLQEELEYLNDYLNIMKLQMGDNLKYEIDMEDDFRNILCLKAILQPIVENSLRHGFQLTGRPAFIKIRIGYLGSSHIYIIVSDNGVGFSADKLEKIQSQLENSDDKPNLKGIVKVGLVNVNYRLKTFYKDGETGISINNLGKREGAEVKLVFPIQRKGEN